MGEASVGEEYLRSVRGRWTAMKRLGEYAIDQLSDEDLVWVANEECNSVAVIIQHLQGNMISRWTDTMTTDGDKPGRDRDSEFVLHQPADKATITAKWEEGWACLLAAMESFTADDLMRTIKIRGHDLSLLDGINRQLIHVSGHLSQIMQIAKERLGANWKTASIARGQSGEYKGKPGD